MAVATTVLQVVSVLVCGLGCASSSVPSFSADAATTMDVGPPEMFIMGDIAGATWIATHNIVPVVDKWVFQHANVEESTDSPEWYLNLTLLSDTYPQTLECAGNYIEFSTGGVNPERVFVSRTQTGTCSVTFVKPTTPDVYEGTFTANLTERGKMMDYAVTNGRFRLPRAP